MGEQILIVGLGLIGGSCALGLKAAGRKADALDTDADTIAWAQRQGMIARGATGGAQAQALVKAADCLLLALYPQDILPWLEANQSHLKPGAIVADLCGVKGLFLQPAQELLGAQNELISCHPMAGREVGGVRNANAALFHGANFLITPTARNTKEGIAFARALAQTLNFGKVTELAPEEHDRMIGYVSQLTHAIAVSLMNANGDSRLPDVTGDSFRDLTRIANMNEELWSELFLANAPALSEEIGLFAEALAALRRRLDAGDKEGLKELFRQSTARRREFEKR